MSEPVLRGDPDVDVGGRSPIEWLLDLLNLLKPSRSRSELVATAHGLSLPEVGAMDEAQWRRVK